MDNDHFADEKQYKLFVARGKQRSSMQQAMLAVWNFAGYLQVKGHWDSFWAAWDAYFDACKLGDAEAIATTGGEFDRLSAQCVRFVNGEHARLARRLAEGTHKALDASDACLEVSHLRNS